MTPRHGIDISTAMVAKLRETTAGDQLSITMGDFVDVKVSGTRRPDTEVSQ